MWFKSYEPFHLLTTIGRTNAQQKLRPSKKGCYACQLLDGVDMHTNAKFDQTILRGSRVMRTLTNW